MAGYHESMMGCHIVGIFKDVESAFAWLRENRLDGASDRVESARLANS
jgi:hypothetical protein